MSAYVVNVVVAIVVDVVVVDLNTPRDKFFIPGSLGAGRKEMIETSWKQLLLTSAMLAACKQTSSPALHPPHIKSQAPTAYTLGGCNITGWVWQGPYRAYMWVKPHPKTGFNYGQGIQGLTPRDSQASKPYKNKPL